LIQDGQKLNHARFLLLTTTGRKSGKPHEVELWFAIEGTGVYLSHEGDPTDWMKNIAKNPKVVAKIESTTIRANAKIVGDGSKAREVGKKALYNKYYGKASKEVIDDWFELSTVIELTPD
jgi:deazaflavin-dependent oxidoreductase (nitroreductase family)